MVLTDGQIPFLLHLESYLVYEKGYKVGHCHQLGLLLVHCCQYIEASLKIILSFYKYNISCCLKKETGLWVEYDNQ